MIHPEARLYQPRAHHDDAGSFIGSYEMRPLRLRSKGGFEFLTGYHVHTRGLSISNAEGIIQNAELIDRYTVVRIQGCESPLDNRQLQGTFIILKRRETAPPHVPIEPIPTPRPPERKTIERFPAETLTPEDMGERLFATFEGYDRNGQPSSKLSFLLQHYLISGTDDGHPDYELPSSETEPVRPWEKYYARAPATTEKYTPNSPHITPSSLHSAREIITLTYSHHFFRNRQVEQHDMVFTRDGDTITPFSYIKGEEPIEPLALNLDDVLSDPLWNNSETMIQLWKLPAKMDTYHLQATLKTHSMSLIEFVRFLGTRPEERQNPGERIF